MSWLGKTLCPPDCLVKSDKKNPPSCAAIFRLGIVAAPVAVHVRVGEVVCGLHDAHVRVIRPTRDVTHVRKMYQALSRLTVLQATGSWAGPGNEATAKVHVVRCISKAKIMLKSQCMHACTGIKSSCMSL